METAHKKPLDVDVFKTLVFLSGILAKYLCRDFYIQDSWLSERASEC